MEKKVLSKHNNEIITILQRKCTFFCQTLNCATTENDADDSGCLPVKNGANYTSKMHDDVLCNAGVSPSSLSNFPLSLLYFSAITCLIL